MIFKVVNARTNNSEVIVSGILSGTKIKKLHKSLIFK